MKGMTEALGLHRAGGGHQRLGQHLAAKHPLDRLGRRKTAEEIFFDFLQVEQSQQPGQRTFRHLRPSRAGNCHYLY